MPLIGKQMRKDIDLHNELIALSGTHMWCNTPTSTDPRKRQINVIIPILVHYCSKVGHFSEFYKLNFGTYVFAPIKSEAFNSRCFLIEEIVCQLKSIPQNFY